MTNRYWTNRLARPDETSAILKLVRAVHGEDHPELNESYFCWRYLSNTEFRADIIMAEQDGCPLGIQPMAIFDWRWGSEPIKGAMYTGVLTHPDHRRKGIFRTLIDSSNEHAANRQAQFVMTLPNDQSLPGFLRFGGWQYPGLIPLAVKVIGASTGLRAKIGTYAASPLGWLARQAFRSKRLDGADSLTHELVTRVPDELDNVGDQFARDCGALMIRRTANYWNWRYLERPGVNYRTHVARSGSEVVGSIVTTIGSRFGMDIGMLVDVVTSGGVPTLRSLIRCAERDLAALGMGVVACQATSSMLRLALSQEGYWMPPPKWLPKHFHFVFRPTGVPGLPRMPGQISDWHLTFGDSDNV